MLSQLLGGDPLGAALFLALITIPISWCISVWLAKQFQQAVVRSMYATAAPTPHPSAEPPPSQLEFSPTTEPLEFTILNANSKIELSPPAQKLLEQANQAAEQTVLIYAWAGGVQAILATFVQLWVYQTGPTPMRLLVLIVLFAWPLVLTFRQVGVGSQPFKTLTSPVYGGTLVVLTFLSGVQPVWGLFFLWLGLMGMPTLIQRLVSNRALQGIGPLVLPAVLAVAFGVNLAFTVTTALALTRGGINLFNLIMGGLFIAGCTVLAGKGVKWIAHQYSRKQMSEQTLLLDAWWLLFTLWEALIFSAASGVGVLVLFAFAGYKLVQGVGMSQLLHSAQPQGVRLLWLRVFGPQQPSTRLLDEIGWQWRYIGSIQMIAGPDLATTYLEPHELIEFINRRLSRQFIKNSPDLHDRIAEMDVAPDPDGRYRVNKFFCHDDTWKMTFRSLTQQREAILMDLRGLSLKRAGALFELQTLINEIPTEAFVLLIAAKSKSDCITVLSQLWRNMLPQSPNYGRSPTSLKILEMSNQSRENLEQLVSLLCQAATA